jgi:Zn-dependent protease
MKAQVKLGRIAGISIGLHYSWFIIALLIVLSLVQHFRSVAPPWSSMVVWMAAVVTGLLFFAAFLLHELAHSLVAKTRGLRVRAITLFALGGVSQIETEASDAKSEFWIAIAGPITSAVIGLVLLGTAWLNGWKSGADTVLSECIVCLNSHGWPSLRASRRLPDQSRRDCPLARSYGSTKAELKRTAQMALRHLGY